MEDIIDNNAAIIHKRLLSNGDSCHLNPILLISSRKELSLQHFHTMEEGTPQVITGVVKLTYTRGHSTRLLGCQLM